MATKQREKKYHISINNEIVECHAYKRACPRGPASQHFSSIEKAMVVADKFNENKVKSKFEMYKLEDGTVILSANCKEQFRELSNASLTIHKIDNTISSIKEKMRQKMVEKNISSLQTPYGSIKSIAEADRKSVDIDKLKEDGLYYENLKDSNAKAFTYFDVLGKDAKTKRDAMEKAEDVDVDFNIVIDEDTGEYVLDEKSLEFVKSLYDLDQANKQAKEKYDELRNQLCDEMEEEGIPNIRFGNTAWVRTPETTKKIVDTKLLREKKIYDKYAKTTKTKPQLRIKWDVQAA